MENDHTSSSSSEEDFNENDTSSVDEESNELSNVTATDLRTRFESIQDGYSSDDEVGLAQILDQLSGTEDAFNAELADEVARQMHHSSFKECQSTNLESQILSNNNTVDLATGLELSCTDTATLEILNLLDSTRAPRGLYDQLLVVIRKHERNGFNICKAMGRDKFMVHLQKIVPSPTLVTVVIDGVTLYRFPFKEMLQDLLLSQRENFHVYNPTIDSIPGSGSELWNTPWMKDTYNMMISDDQTEILIPIILYMDKTGTDSFQRYPLEPVLFSIANLDQSTRQFDRAWRHVGLMGNTSHIDDSQKSLQFYHRCLAALLSDIKDFQNSPSPICVWINNEKRTLIPKTPVMIVMGDQLSQDTLCARMKVNAGGACRVHRGCMCSFLHCSDPDHKCMPIPMDHFQKIKSEANNGLATIESIMNKGSKLGQSGRSLAKQSLESRYLFKKWKMNVKLLNRPFTTHPIEGAFSGINFGSWVGGIYEATFDDFMHSGESGVLTYVGEATFNGLQPKAREAVEKKIQKLLIGIRSSVREDYPRWRLQAGFSRQTLMTSVERAGSLFSLIIALHDQDIAKIFNAGHARQVEKYYTFANTKVMQAESESLSVIPPDTKRRKVTIQSSIHESKGRVASESRFFWEDYIDPYPEFLQSNYEHTLEHMVRHGFDCSLIPLLDQFQIQQMFSNCKKLFAKSKYPNTYPSDEYLEGSYTDMGPKLIQTKVFKDCLNKIKSIMQEEYIPAKQNIPIKNIPLKHWKKKSTVSGIGSTSAIMSAIENDKNYPMREYSLLLEYILCYRQFCHDSSTIPPAFLNKMSDVIDFGGRNLVRYMDKMIYRGDDTIDFRTTKVHAQIRTGANFSSLLNLEHTNCKTGERLLKTKAKQAAVTAQQRPGDFEGQVASRILDRHLLDMATELNTYDTAKRNVDVPMECDRFYRRYPNLIVERCDDGLYTIYDVGNKGQKKLLKDELKALPPNVIKKMMDTHPEWRVFWIYYEVRLRDNLFSVKAYPNYKGSGPWHDFISVCMESDKGDTNYEPARVLSFYSGENDKQKYALVHTSSTLKGREYQDTLLIAHRHLEYLGKDSATPRVSSIELESIERPLMTIPHRSTKTMFDASNNGFMCVRPRDEWSYLWIAWNDILMKKNKNVGSIIGKRKTMGKYINLNDTTMICETRESVTRMLEENLDNSSATNV